MATQLNQNEFQYTPSMYDKCRHLTLHKSGKNEYDKNFKYMYCEKYHPFLSFMSLRIIKIKKITALNTYIFFVLKLFLRPGFVFCFLSALDPPIPFSLWLLSRSLRQCLMCLPWWCPFITTVEHCFSIPRK